MTDRLTELLSNMSGLGDDNCQECGISASDHRYLFDLIAEQKAEIERLRDERAVIFKKDAELRNALADAHCVFDLGKTKWWEAYGHLLEEERGLASHG